MSKRVTHGAYTRDSDGVRVTAVEVQVATPLDFLVAQPGELLVTEPGGGRTIWTKRAFEAHHTAVKSAGG